MATMPFGIIQGHQLSYQWKAHMRLPIGDQYWLASYLIPFPSYCRLLVNLQFQQGYVFNALIWGDSL